MSRCRRGLNVVFINLFGLGLFSLELFSLVFWGLGLFRLGFPTLSLLALGWQGELAVAQAPPPVKPKFPFPNPLEMQEMDPQLPLGVYSGQRSLTPLEVRSLTQLVNQLQRQGGSQFEAGLKSAAYETWFRELRLRRYLGLDSEIPALGRVGDVAWEGRETTSVRVITERLQQIEQSLPTTGTLDPQQVRLQQSLGQAYEQVRATTLATAVYQQELAQAQRLNAVAPQAIALTALAELYFKDLNYPDAIANYRSLLALVRQHPAQFPVATGPTLAPPRRQLTTHNPVQRFTPQDPIGKPLNELEILTQLAYVYGQNQQYGDVINTTEEIIQLYYRAGQLTRIPALKVIIAQQYENLKQTDRALATWQTVYNQAIELQEFSYAATALQALASYYRDQNQLDTAVGLYQYLLDVEVRADNSVGQMEALDQLGQLYLRQQNFPQASIVFQRGLAIANQVRYRQDYFAQQLTLARSAPAATTVEPATVEPAPATVNPALVPSSPAQP